MHVTQDMNLWVAEIESSATKGNKSTCYSCEIVSDES